MMMCLVLWMGHTDRRLDRMVLHNETSLRRRIWNSNGFDRTGTTGKRETLKQVSFKTTSLLLCLSGR